MVGFATKKKEKRSQKEKKDEAAAANKLKQKDKKKPRKEKKEKKRKKTKKAKDRNNATEEETYAANVEVQLHAEDLVRDGKLEQHLLDSIEKHREEYDVVPEDHIEKHREEYDAVDKQMPKLHDWYEQESLAMDLESLKRKPWYKKGAKASEGSGVQPLQEPDFANNEDDEDTQSDAGSSHEEYPSHEESQEEEGDDYETDDQSDQDYNDVDKSPGRVRFEDGSCERHQHTRQSQPKSSRASHSPTRHYDVEEEWVGLTEEEKAWISQEEQEYDFIHNQGVPVGVRSRRVIEDEAERLEYCRRSLARLEKIEEIRKSRERLKVEMEKKKKRRKARYDRVRRSKQVERESRRAEKLYSPSKSKYRMQQSNNNQPFLMVDLTDVCDRRHDGASQEKKHSKHHWTDGLKQDLPVIVDLTDYKHPHPVIDLTKMEDPQSDHSVISCGNYGEPFVCHNRRLEKLRRDREKKLHNMTDTFGLTTKGSKKEEQSPYQKMMESITQNIKTAGCGLGY